MMSTTMNSFNIKSNRQKEEQQDDPEPLVEQEIDELQVQYEQDLSRKSLSQINNINEDELEECEYIRVKLDFTLNSLLDL